MSDDDERFEFTFDEDVEWSDEEIQEFIDSVGNLEGCHEE